MTLTKTQKLNELTGSTATGKPVVGANSPLMLRQSLASTLSSRMENGSFKSGMT